MSVPLKRDGWCSETSDGTLECGETSPGIRIRPFQNTTEFQTCMELKKGSLRSQKRAALLRDQKKDVPARRGPSSRWTRRLLWSRSRACCGVATESARGKNSPRRTSCAGASRHRQERTTSRLEVPVPTRGSGASQSALFHAPRGSLVRIANERLSRFPPALARSVSRDSIERATDTYERVSRRSGEYNARACRIRARGTPTHTQLERDLFILSRNQAEISACVRHRDRGCRQ